MRETAAWRCLANETEKEKMERNGLMEPNCQNTHTHTLTHQLTNSNGNKSVDERKVNAERIDGKLQQIMSIQMRLDVTKIELYSHSLSVFISLVCMRVIGLQNVFNEPTITRTTRN